MWGIKLKVQKQKRYITCGWIKRIITDFLPEIMKAEGHFDKTDKCVKTNKIANLDVYVQWNIFWRWRNTKIFRNNKTKVRSFFTRSLEVKEILKEVFQIEGKKQKFGSVQT